MMLIRLFPTVLIIMVLTLSVALLWDETTEGWKIHKAVEICKEKGKLVDHTFDSIINASTTVVCSDGSTWAIKKSK